MAWFMLSLLKCNNYVNCDLDSINSEPSVSRHIIVHVHNIIIVSVNSEPSAPRYPYIIRVNTDGIEPNWIPPLEPNRDVYNLIK